MFTINKPIMLLFNEVEDLIALSNAGNAPLLFIKSVSVGLKFIKNEWV